MITFARQAPRLNPKVPKVVPGILAIVVAGILMNTSLVNIAGFGIPVFYAIVPMLLVGYLVRNMRAANASYRLESKKSFVLAAVIAVLLVSVVAAHLLLGRGDPATELRQLVARIAFLALFVVTAVVVSNRRAVLTALHYMKTLLKLFVLYGLYEIPAKMFGLPLFLEFLRNSASFSVQTYMGPEGWLSTYRIRSIWAEPSFSALPIGVLLYLLLYHANDRRERVLWTTLAALYSFLTFSRAVWVVFMLVLLVIVLLSALKWLDKRYLFGTFKLMKLPIVLLAILMGTSWIIFADHVFEDLSSEGRAASAVVGARIFLDHPLFGSGMNTYSEYDGLPRYRGDLELLFPENIVHNLFIGYAQQMGILGIVYSVLPILFVLFLRRIPFDQRFFIASLFCAIGVFSGDFYYFPLTWLLLGLLAAYDYQLAHPNRRSGERLRVAAAALPAAGAPGASRT